MTDKYVGVGTLCGWFKPTKQCANILVVIDINEEHAHKKIDKKNYTIGLQRAFKKVWEYDLKLLSDKVFGCPLEGLLAVVDNRAHLLQRQERHPVSHNIFSADNVIQALLIIVFVKKCAYWISHPSQILCWNNYCYETKWFRYFHA